MAATSTRSRPTLACAWAMRASPRDGARLVDIRDDPALEIEQVWSMKIDGSDQRFITGAGGPDPNVSPDGRKISFKGPP